MENCLEFTLGWCDLRRGALAEAEVRARKGLAAFPGDAFRHDLLARILSARGDAEGARKARSDGRALAHPDSFIARELAER
jgi:Flp pilus assembly protein TadD